MPEILLHKSMKAPTLNMRWACIILNPSLVWRFFINRIRSNEHPATVSPQEIRAELKNGNLSYQTLYAILRSKRELNSLPEIMEFGTSFSEAIQEVICDRSVSMIGGKMYRNCEPVQDALLARQSLLGRDNSHQ